MREIPWVGKGSNYEGYLFWNYDILMTGVSWIGLNSYGGFSIFVYIFIGVVINGSSFWHRKLSYYFYGVYITFFDSGLFLRILFGTESKDSLDYNFIYL